MKKLKAYLASPYGFSDSTRYFLEKVYVPTLKEVVEVINPWELTSLKEIKDAEAAGRLEKFNMEIGKRNEDAISSADIVIAALDGQEVDAGVAAEIGFAAAKGKRIIGYRSDIRESGEKAVTVTLQVQYFIEASGGKIVKNLDELKKALQIN